MEHACMGRLGNLKSDSEQEWMRGWHQWIGMGQDGDLSNGGNGKDMSAGMVCEAS